MKCNDCELKNECWRVTGVPFDTDPCMRCKKYGYGCNDIHRFSKDSCLFDPKEVEQEVKASHPEIKFRVFAKGVKKMLYFENPGLVVCNFDEGPEFGMGLRLVDGAAYMTKYSDLMQYTGLKDKNGKEIYEGDIILDDSYGEDVGRLVDTVVWGNEAGAWVWKTDDTALIAQSIDTIEVVGNIYENPKLLKELK